MIVSRPLQVLDGTSRQLKRGLNFTGIQWPGMVISVHRNTRTLLYVLPHLEYNLILVRALTSHVNFLDDSGCRG